MRARPLRLALALGVAGALALAACGDDDGGSSTNTTAAAAATTAAPATTAASTTAKSASTTAAGATTTAKSSSTTASSSGATTTAGEEEESGPEELTLKDSSLGEILTDAEGHTVYVFFNDKPNEPSTCSGSCAANWPAVTTDGQPVASGGVDAGMLGTTTNPDGKTQVTYNGQNLYYFAADKSPGDVNGQGVGSVWYVVGADGKAITTTK